MSWCFSFCIFPDFFPIYAVFNKKTRPNLATWTGFNDSLLHSNVTKIANNPGLSKPAISCHVLAASSRLLFVPPLLMPAFGVRPEFQRGCVFFRFLSASHLRTCGRDLSIRKPSYIGSRSGRYKHRPGLVGSSGPTY